MTVVVMVLTKEGTQVEKIVPIGDSDEVIITILSVEFEDISATLVPNVNNGGVVAFITPVAWTLLGYGGVGESVESIGKTAVEFENPVASCL